MGQTLSEPVTEKHTSFGEDDTLMYGVSEMQGWRISMEDAHATILNLDGKTGDEKTSFFAVYDGHGGSTVAEFSGQTVHTRLADLPEYKEGNYEAALKRAFLGTDEDLRASPEYASDPSGCTAVAALLVAGPKPKPGEEGKTVKVARRIIVANAGDSRSVLSLKGEAKPMSYDHKPGNTDENARIVGAGGFVEFGRVNGNLALSRAIGDFEFKQNSSLPAEKQIVTADPEIISHEVTGEEEFLVLACDGIWDCLSNQQVVDYARRGFAKGKECKDICEELMDKCLAPDSEIGGVGCDNMTICIVALLNGKTKDEWYAWVKERVENNVGWDTPEEIAPVFQSQGGTGQGTDGPALTMGGGAGGPGAGGIRIGGLGGLGGFGGGSVLSALAGGLQQGSHDEQPQGIRLPGALAGALSGAGIVFRPGSSLSEDGEQLYEAHIVDEHEDESSSDGEGEQGASAGAGSDESRPALTHQPEIVESPQQVDSSTMRSSGGGSAESSNKQQAKQGAAQQGQEGQSSITVRPTSEEGAKGGTASREGDSSMDVDVPVAPSHDSKN